MQNLGSMMMYDNSYELELNRIESTSTPIVDLSSILDLSPTNDSPQRVKPHAFGSLLLFSRNFSFLAFFYRYKRLGYPTFHFLL